MMIVSLKYIIEMLSALLTPILPCIIYSRLCIYEFSMDYFAAHMGVQGKGCGKRPDVN